jgi:hypothetical protein
MTRDDEAQSRAELARWFLDHDEVDEAARLLEPGDELELGRSDSLDLAAALSRRGLSGSYEDRRFRVNPPAAAGPRATIDSIVGDLPTSARKPPVRTGAAPLTVAKKMV